MSVYWLGIFCPEHKLGIACECPRHGLLYSWDGLSIDSDLQILSVHSVGWGYYGFDMGWTYAGVSCSGLSMGWTGNVLSWALEGLSILCRLWPGKGLELAWCPGHGLNLECAGEVTAWGVEALAWE